MIITVCLTFFADLIHFFISVLLSFNSFSFDRINQNSFDLGRWGRKISTLLLIELILLLWMMVRQYVLVHL